MNEILGFRFLPGVERNKHDVCSGIVLHMERSFEVGDRVQVVDLPEGGVADITWRTTRIKTRNGCIVSAPNAQVSESSMNNHSAEGVVRRTQHICLDPRYGPEQVRPVLTRALESVPERFAKKTDGSPMAEARYFGPVSIYGSDYGRYWLACWVENYQTFVPATDGVSKAVYRELEAVGIDVGIVHTATPLLAGGKGPGDGLKGAADKIADVDASHDVMAAQHGSGA